MLDAKFSSTTTMRLAELHSMDVFYTPLEARFDRLTRMLRQLLSVPVAAIGITHREMLWFKSISGWNATELKLNRSFAQATLKQSDVLIVNDARKDPRFTDIPIVRGEPNFRFYAATTLLDTQSLPVGVLEVYDVQPRSLSPSQIQSLNDIAAIAQKEILTTELRNAQVEFIGKLDIARRQASIDEVTRVWNRRAGVAVIRSMLEEAQKTNESIAVCAVDIDGFKQVNDELGHPAGDKVLRKVAQRLVASLRGEDIICRYGGDEFLIGLSGLTHESIDQLMNRICLSVNNSPIRTRQGNIKISVSIGIEFHENPAGHTEEYLESMIEAADSALYKAKHRGRNGVFSVRPETAIPDAVKQLIKNT